MLIGRQAKAFGNYDGNNKFWMFQASFDDTTFRKILNVLKTNSETFLDYFEDNNSLSYGCKLDNCNVLFGRNPKMNGNYLLVQWPAVFEK